MIVAIHQPHFCPWLGYFDRMLKADLFVLLDHVQYEHQNYQNRVRIKGHKGAQWITVPVLHASHKQPISEKLIYNHQNGRENKRSPWARDMYLTFESVYKGTAYFKDYAPALESILSPVCDKLVELDWKFIEFIMNSLKIRKPVIRSSQLNIVGQKSEMALNICKTLDADALLCGLGGTKEYLNQELLERNGVKVLWQEFRHPRYVQYPRSETFVEGLSSLDLLFNCGPRAGEILRSGAFVQTTPSLKALPSFPGKLDLLGGTPAPGIASEAKAEISQATIERVLNDL